MIYVNSVRIYPETITLETGCWYYQAYAEVCPENADCKEVTWYSDDPAIASVNYSSGYIYARSVGVTRIHAMATDGSGCCDYLTVTVKKSVPVRSVTLDHSYLSLEKGTDVTLHATVCPENATNRRLNWHSNNPNVATVSNGGTVTAISKGSTIITATAADGSLACDCCNVTVTTDILVSSVNVVPSSKTMPVGTSAFLDAILCPTNAAKPYVSWSSANESIATVNPSSGLVYAKSPGTVVIYATAIDGGGMTGSCTLTVTEPIRVEDIILSRTNLSLYNSNTYRLTATVCPTNATNKTVFWSSSNPYVATVNSRTGYITAKSAGRATIFATAMDGSEVESCCTVIVKQTVLCPAEETPSNASQGSSSNPVDIYNGAHILNNTLLELFDGQRLKFVAHYDSTQLATGELGSGWYHNYEKHIEIKGNNAYVYNNPSIFSRYTAESNCRTRFTCCSANKNGYVLTVDYSSRYPYKIDCNSAMTEYYNESGDLAKIVDHQGFEILISYAPYMITITDGVSGQKMYLEKNSDCRICRVYDDAGRQARLTYTGNHLTLIFDASGYMLTYAYDKSGRVKSSVDATGVCCFKNVYDAYGRVIEQKDAIFNSLAAKFAYKNDKRIMTDRNGKQSSRQYDCNGLLIKYTDENGNATTYEYDDRYNVIKETDAKGNSITRCYNCFNKPTQITDKNGNKTSFTYDSAGNVTKIRYPAVHNIVPVETFVYNSRNQVIRHTDVRGTVTVYTYDANGMPASKKVGSKNAILYSYQNGLLKSKTDALGNTTSYTHNALGQVISVTNADNKTTEYEYDVYGNLLLTIDANGNTIVNAYDKNYQKISVTDANGNKTLYFHNANRINNAVTFPDNNIIQYEFDGEDRPVKITDQGNNVTTITYDDAGRVISQRSADGAIVQCEYDPVGNVVKETNPKGAVVAKTYDKAGNLLTVTDSDGNTTSYEYNAMSKVVKVINSVAGTTVYTYSPAGDLLSETDALGNTRTYTYDAFGNRITATDAKNNVTTYTYDQNNNLLTVNDALGHITTYTYNCLNQCVAVKDALNNTIRYGYDALGRRITITDARGNVFTNVYDGNGNVIKTIDAKGNTINETVYNCLNLPLTVTDAMGKVTAYTYNALGKVESITDSLNHRTEFTYNACGQNTSVRDAANHTSTATYDLLGNITRLAGPLGGATNYTYDNAGKLIAETTPSGGTVQYTYNELDVIKKLTNARGQIHQFFYDAMGRITGYTAPEGSVSFHYDANGNVLTVTDSNGTITRTYDALNRITSCTDTYGKIIRYEYDAVGNLSKLIYPDNTAVTYTYDADHNLTRVTDWANRVTAYTYDANNRIVGVTKPDGSTTVTVYDNKQRVVSTVEKTADDTVITGFEYTYDDLSRIVEEKVLANSTKICYTYDGLSRVTARTIKKLSDNSILASETYAYDAAGNILDAPDSCFQYDTNNRLTVFNDNQVTHDPDGNMLSNGSLLCTYDSANKLLSAGGHTYSYNAENVRIRNLCEDEDTTYTYNTNCKLSQLLVKVTGSVTTKYVYGKGLIGEESNGKFKTYHFDSRGSTIAITDENGNITDTFAYDTYGKQIARTGTSTIIFGYNGMYSVITDKNGLVYMRARYYSPEMRRFINADIVAGMLTEAISLNRYAYANANPVLNVDPYGLSCYCGGTGCKGCLDMDTWAKLMSGEITLAEAKKIGNKNNGSSNKGGTISTSFNDTEPSYISNPYQPKEEIPGIEGEVPLEAKYILYKTFNVMQTAHEIYDVAEAIKYAKYIKDSNVRLVINKKHINPKGKKRVLTELGLSKQGLKINDMDEFKRVAKYVDSTSAFIDELAKSFDTPSILLDAVLIGIDITYEISNYDSPEDKWIIGGYTAIKGTVSVIGSAVGASTGVAAATTIMATTGSVIPGVGTAAGAVAGFITGIAIDILFEQFVDDHIIYIVENN